MKCEKRLTKYRLWWYTVRTLAIRMYEVNEMAKVTITMPDELLSSLDEYADRTYTTRSGAITMMVNGYLTSRQLTSNLSQIVHCLETLSEGKQLSDEEQQQLSAFVSLSKLLPT